MPWHFLPVDLCWVWLHLLILVLRPISSSPVERPGWRNAHSVKSSGAKLMQRPPENQWRCEQPNSCLLTPCVIDFDRLSAEVQRPSKWLWRKRFLCFVTWTLNRLVLLFRFECLAGASADASISHLLSYRITFHNIYKRSGGLICNYGSLALKWTVLRLLK